MQLRTRQTIGRKLLMATMLQALVLNQSACGRADLAETNSELSEGGQSVGDLLGFSQELQDHMKTIGNIVDAAGSIVGAAGAVKSVLELFGILESHEAKLFRKLRELDEKLDRILQVSIAGTNILARRMVEEKLGTIRAANSALKDHLQHIQNGGGDTESDRVQRGVLIASLKEALHSLAGESFSQRPFDNHVAVQGDWMYSIPDRAESRDGAVFDHRLALPVLLEGIAIRILWMSAEEPEFHSNGRFASELGDYARYIRTFIAKMEAGIRCSTVPAHWTTAHSVLPTGCVDIHSGIASFDQQWLVNENQKSPIVPYNLQNVMKRHAQRLVADRFNTQLSLGVFQLYSLADKLEKLTVVKFGRIPFASDKSLKQGVHYWVDTNPLWPGVYYRSTQWPCAPDDGPGVENCTLLGSNRFRRDVSYWVDSNPSWPGVYYKKINSQCPFGGSDAGPNCQVVSFKSSI